MICATFIKGPLSQFGRMLGAVDGHAEEAVARDLGGKPAGRGADLGVAPDPPGE
jgi:hypothetical protein